MSSETRRRVKFSDKLAAAFSILLEKGPLSISSLAEEVSKLVGGKVSTTRSQLSVALEELIEYKLVEEVGSDRFGSRLIDISPYAIVLLLSMLSTGMDFRYMKWESLIKYFERKLPNYVGHVKLLKIIAEEWAKTTLGEVSEEEKNDFLEELANALSIESELTGKWRPTTIKDLPDDLMKLIEISLENCIEDNCNIEGLLKKINEAGLSNLLKEVLERRIKRTKTLEKIIKALG